VATGPREVFPPSPHAASEIPEGRDPGDLASHWRTVRRLSIAVGVLTMLLVASLILVVGLLVWN
jgi:hypothetical protein